MNVSQSIKGTVRIVDLTERKVRKQRMVEIVLSEIQDRLPTSPSN